MKAYYINLARRPDRRAQMEEQFVRLGLEFERIEAVTPDALTQQQRQRHLAPGLYHRLQPTELCCNLGHRAALDRFVTSEQAFGVILEDDAVLSSLLPELLQRIDTEGMPAGILRLETYAGPVQLSRRPVAHLGAFGLHTILGWVWGSAAYVVSRPAAIALLASPALDQTIVDRATWRRFPDTTGQRVLHLVPALAIQRDRLEGTGKAGSDLEAERALALGDARYSPVPLAHRLRRFRDDELGVALPALLSRWRGRSQRTVVPFAQD